MASVQVLCPNGRRQTVKVTPNTKILQILEEVCKKQNFMPPEDYNLIHGNARKVLDITLSVRFAGLPNNAKLELVKSKESRAEQDVLIALQLENGDRLQASFPPVTALWDLLLHWEHKENSDYKGKLTKVDTSTSPPTQPVCIYMRDEIIGEMALQDTTLRKLGLTSGKAVIRLSHRPVEDSLMAEIIDKLEKEKKRNMKLNDLVARQTSVPEIKQAPVSTTMPPPCESSLVQKQAETAERSSSSESMDVEQELTNQKTALEQSQSNKSIPMEVESNSSINKSNVPSSNIVSEHTSSEMVEVDKSRTLSESGQRQISSQQRAAESIRELNIPGVEVYTPQDFHDLPPDQQAIARRLATSYLFSVGLAEGQQQQQQQPGTRPKKLKSMPQSQPQSSFGEFKFPEETKGKALYHNEASDVQHDEYRPCDREAVVYDLEEKTKQSLTAGEELPDSFFEITERDLKQMMIDNQKRVEELSEQPLMSKSLREAKKEEKYSKYERVVVRVQFPDKLVLQGLFRPRETVFSLQKFVKAHLENKSRQFYLYTSPPKYVLKDTSKTLIQSNLVPASVVYFGVAGDEDKKEHYLSDAILKQIRSRLEAEKVVDKWFPTDEASLLASPGGSSTPSASANIPSKPQKQNKPEATSDKEPGVPKWFKIGKK